MDSQGKNLEQKLGLNSRGSTSQGSISSIDQDHDPPRLSYLEHLLPGSLFCGTLGEDIPFTTKAACYVAEIGMCAIPNLGFYNNSVTVPLLVYCGLRAAYVTAMNHLYADDKNGAE